MRTSSDPSGFDVQLQYFNKESVVSCKKTQYFGKARSLKDHITCINEDVISLLNHQSGNFGLWNQELEILNLLDTAELRESEP